MIFKLSTPSREPLDGPFSLAFLPETNFNFSLNDFPTPFINMKGSNYPIEINVHQNERKGLEFSDYIK